MPLERVRVGLVGPGMAIDKESSGVPEVDFKRRTTKVNLWLIVGVGVFLLISSAFVYWYAR
jgi:hypothetical protein